MHIYIFFRFIIKDTYDEMLFINPLLTHERVSIEGIGKKPTYPCWINSLIISWSSVAQGRVSSPLPSLPSRIEQLDCLVDVVRGDDILEFVDVCVGRRRVANLEVVADDADPDLSSLLHVQLALGAVERDLC